MVAQLGRAVEKTSILNILSYFNMKIFILEDDFERIRQFCNWYSRCNMTITNNVKDAVSAIIHAAEIDDPYDVIFLDHDLGGRIYVDTSDPNTGSEVVRKLVETDVLLSNPHFIIHSMNTAAAISMEQALNSTDRFSFVHRIPFNKLDNETIDIR